MYIKPTLEFMMNSHLVVLQKSILALSDELKVWLVIVQAFNMVIMVIMVIVVIVVTMVIVW